MATECQRCKAGNPDGKRFCGDCGAPLDPTLVVASQLVDTSVQGQIQSILAERYKDQKLLELETTQAIAARLLEWAKLLGFFVGIPVAVLLLILAALGIKTYSDFVAQVNKAQTDITTNLRAAQANAEKLKADGETLASEYEKLRIRYHDTADIAAQLETLSKRVDTIGEKLGFTPSSKVSESTKRQIEAAFAKYQQYLNRLGYRGTGGSIEVDIQNPMKVPGAIAYYEPDKRRMVIDSKYASEETVLYREYTHHVLYSASPTNASSGESWAYYSIESALAWYLPCSFVGNPKPSVGSWDLTKKRSFGEIRPDLGSAMADGTEIWGSAFWEIRQVLGQQVADKLLFDTWFKLRPADVIRDRGASFVKLLLESQQPHASQIREIFGRRGLAL
jgi:hypothetical protein